MQLHFGLDAFFAHLRQGGLGFAQIQHHTLLQAEHLPTVFGTGRGWLATTEDELDTALAEAMASDELGMIRAVVPKGDRSPALLRLTDALGKRV